MLVSTICFIIIIILLIVVIVLLLMQNGMKSVPANATAVTAPIAAVPQEPDPKEESNVRPGYYKPRGWVREQLVCQSLERIYQKPFPTVRPAFLINPDTKERLEYDCYNHDLKIAGEHNGEHHYNYPNTFHKTLKQFEDQVKRDKYKFSLSNSHGVYQIVVPYWVPINMIPAWVEYHCPEQLTKRQQIEQLKSSISVRN